MEGELRCTHIGCTPASQATAPLKPDLCGAFSVASLSDPRARDPLGPVNRHASHLQFAKGGKTERCPVPDLTEFL